MGTNSKNDRNSRRAGILMNLGIVVSVIIAIA